MTDEIEKPYKEKFKKQEADLEESTTNYNKLRYELSFLKSEYEHTIQEHQRIVEELRLQHEAEVRNLYYQQMVCQLGCVRQIQGFILSGFLEQYTVMFTMQFRQKRHGIYSVHDIFMCEASIPNLVVD